MAWSLTAAFESWRATMNDVFLDYGVDEVKSPPQPVNERDIVSSTRTVYNAWYIDRLHEKHSMTFNVGYLANRWLEQEADRLRGIV